METSLLERGKKITVKQTPITQLLLLSVEQEETHYLAEVGVRAVDWKSGDFVVVQKIIFHLTVEFIQELIEKGGGGSAVH